MLDFVISDEVISLFGPFRHGQLLEDNSRDPILVFGVHDGELWLHDGYVCSLYKQLM